MRWERQRCGRWYHFPTSTRKPAVVSYRTAGKGLQDNRLLKKWTISNGQKIRLVWTETKGNENNILRFIIEDLRGNKVSFTPTYDQITCLLLGIEMEEKKQGKGDSITNHWRYILSLAISVLASNGKEFYQAEGAIDDVFGDIIRFTPNVNPIFKQRYGVYTRRVSTKKSQSKRDLKKTTTMDFGFR